MRKHLSFLIQYENGQQVILEKLENSALLEIDVSVFPAGMYFYRITKAENLIQSGKMIVD